LQVLGESKLIIDWMVGFVHFQNMGLQTLMEVVLTWKERLSKASSKHVFRELNTMADKQSKDGVDVPLGILRLVEVKDGIHSEFPPSALWSML